jgi:light-regulated signal transduction histidine kinase (bacteriophytochrome)
MTPDSTGPPQLADLAHCDAEPIQIPGSIQPHGLLLALAEPGLEILQASLNINALLGLNVDTILGRRLGELLGEDLARAVAGSLANPTLLRQPSFLKATVDVDGKSRPFDAILHRAEEALILELEPSLIDDASAFRDLYPLVRSSLTSLEGSAGVLDACRVAAAETRRITGFDRVMIYRFDEGWNGTVIAEDRNDALPSYLDLRFPASDIPAQARALYRINRLRLIPDVGYRPVPIRPANNPRTGRPLDLSLAALRSVSPVHVEYMTNMGTPASM